MKRKQIVCLSALLALVAGCTMDAYDKGEGSYSLLRADFAEAYVGEDLKMRYFITDEGDSLPVDKPYSASWWQTPDSAYRTLMYYALVENGGSHTYAKLMGITRVPTVVPHRQFFFEEGIKTDPVGLESAWLSSNRRYLNLGLLLKVGTTDDENAYHSIGVVADTLLAYPDSTHTLRLQLHHDQGGMPEYYSQRTFVSISTRDCQADTIQLTLNTFEGPVTKTFLLNP